MIPIIIEELTGISRKNEPVTIGIPLPKGYVDDISKLQLLDNKNEPIPFQARVLSSWSDASIKWALFDFQVSVEPNNKIQYHISAQDKANQANLRGTISKTRSGNLIIIDTGAAKFSLSSGSSSLFQNVVIGADDLLSSQSAKFIFTDNRNKKYESHISGLSIETEGPTRTTVKFCGTVKDERGSLLVNISGRLSFFSGSGLVKIESTLHNPRRAQHPGGFWDLGDSGSVVFKDLSLHIDVASNEKQSVKWQAEPAKPFFAVEGRDFEIYQDSSGGQNWKSENHCNRFGQVMNSFQGFRTHAGGELIKEGDRATPSILLSDNQKSVAGTICKFWQNFPKAIEVKNAELIFRLFPKQYKDSFELQGGEQKTHTVFASFENSASKANIQWVHDPLIPRCAPEWYSSSKAVHHLVPYDKDKDRDNISLIESAIKGDKTFFDKRETIDEYGWRNFGDCYADHETEFYNVYSIISHYNNQYDIIYGAIFQYLRSADKNWYIIMEDLARHVMDIDIYHVDSDKAVYNGGLFWHTTHYINAGRATHRTYTRDFLKAKEALYCLSGGPGNEHNYTSGLMYYYYLTGCKQAKEAVLGLAEWVINMEDGAKTIFKMLDRSDTGLSTQTVDLCYQGPGRGAGNSINALLDAFSITGSRRYLEEAQMRINRCINPKDDISRRNLGDPESRWSYTVFLHVLGKYLDMKCDLAETDYMYCYAKDSLLHYAAWMRENEYCYLEKPEKLKDPTGTWAAQEMRKADCFLYAAKYGDDSLRGAFLEKAKYFHDISINRLNKFETKFFVRPIAILLSCGSMYSYFMNNPDEKVPLVSRGHDFENPFKFSPQKIKAKRKFVTCLISGFVLMILIVGMLWLR